MKYIRFELKNNQNELFQELAKTAQEQLSGGQGKINDADDNGAAHLDLLHKAVSQSQIEMSANKGFLTGY